MAIGQILPVRPETGGKKTEGYCTPTQDKRPQVMCVPPKRVLPIVFIPGIMGSNLRVKPKRQAKLQNKNNISWRPDSKRALLHAKDLTPAERQLELDPQATEVDSYDAGVNNTGDSNETTLERNGAVKPKNLYGTSAMRASQILLTDDPPGIRNRRTAIEKALERGWGEVFFDSYGQILQTCEQHLNDAFAEDGTATDWWKKNVLGVKPSAWGATEEPSLDPLQDVLLSKVLPGCWFPVHAMGYNWLQSNWDSGSDLAKRITRLIESYRSKGFDCRKVILVTHSMGGLTARAAMHPAIGAVQDKVLGVVHGVMPAIGAGTAYKRMKCGFEGMRGSWIRKICGETGRDVTAVLANSQGGIELLPTMTYGGGWLQVRHDDRILFALPSEDPYEEIYKNQHAWYRLFNPDWINPSTNKGSSLENTFGLLNGAKAFHQQIQGFYHPESYALYGADRSRQAWGDVIWDVSRVVNSRDVPALSVVSDDARGEIVFSPPDHTQRVTQPLRAGLPAANFRNFHLTLRDAADPGDQTVPVRSADDQFHAGTFKGIFRQVGYEHQGSYSDPKVLACACYSLVRIISKMDWSTK